MKLTITRTLKPAGTDEMGRKVYQDAWQLKRGNVILETLNSEKHAKILRLALQNPEFFKAF